MSRSRATFPQAKRRPFGSPIPPRRSLAFPACLWSIVHPAARPPFLHGERAQQEKSHSSSVSETRNCASRTQQHASSTVLYMRNQTPARQQANRLDHARLLPFPNPHFSLATCFLQEHQTGEENVVLYDRTTQGFLTPRRSNLPRAIKHNGLYPLVCAFSIPTLRRRVGPKTPECPQNHRTL